MSFRQACLNDFSRSGNVAVLIVEDRNGHERTSRVTARFGSRTGRFQAWRGRRKLGRRGFRNRSGRWPSGWQSAWGQSHRHGARPRLLPRRQFAMAAPAQPQSERSCVCRVDFHRSWSARTVGLELDNGAGATMRVQLVGYDAADVEALSRSFWDAL